MENESNIDWKKPVTNKTFILFILLFFFLGGFIIGFAYGGNTVQSSWEEYNNNLQQRIEKECVCLNMTLSCGKSAPLFPKYID